MVPIDLSNRVDVSNKIISVRDLSGEFDLLVATGLANPKALCLGEPFEQLDTLMEHSVPAIVAGILKIEFMKGRPFTKKGCCGVFATEESGHCLFESTAEAHCGA